MALVVVMKWYLRLFQEFFISVALGSVPALLAYHSGGVAMLDANFKSQVPSDPILYYIFSLAFLYPAAIMVERMMEKKSGVLRARAAYWRMTLSEVGTALHSVWRVISGIFIMFPVLWLFEDYSSKNLALAAYIFYVGLFLLFQCFVFSWARSWLESKKSSI